ncbi:ATP-binding protein [Paenibacillus beijingensis]|uniref:ATP-binding protein n=1 Tax=Paenibacillus beijingensis TaxID=1126833 RepID=UPI000695DD1E|nr:ATP-binding protein [Paenibacillus beijingensis]
MHNANDIVYLLLAFIIITFSSYTMFSMIEHLKQSHPKGKRYWLFGGAAVFGLGNWAMHFVAMLASDYMINVRWPSFPAMLMPAIGAYLSFLVLRSRRSSPIRIPASALLICLGSLLEHYFTVLVNPINAAQLHCVPAVLSALIIFLGAAVTIYLFERKSRSFKLLCSCLLGASALGMHLMAMKALIVEYTDVLTADRLNQSVMIMALLLGIAALLILAFSLTAWFADRRYNQMDERYKLLVENSLDMIALIKGGKWEYVNRAGMRMFEVDPANPLAGQSIYPFLHPKHHEDIRKLLNDTGNEKACPEDATGLLELDWYTATGKQLHTELILTKSFFSGKQVFQAIIRDISERKKNEELLINSEKLYVAGQLAAGIAHEIRNPLTSLKGFLQLMSSGRQLGKNYHDIMKSELTRIETIVSELLMLSKPQIYELNYMDVRVIMADTITLLESQAALLGIEIQADLGKSPLWIYGVETQIKQVFINVLKNAVEAMVEGGSIAITLQPINEEIVISIVDCGPGIDEEQLSKMGQPFYTTKEKGTGLGLMVSYKIVDNHNGKINVESELGKGTSFQIILPHAKAGAEG